MSDIKSLYGQLEGQFSKSIFLRNPRVVTKQELQAVNQIFSGCPIYVSALSPDPRPVTKVRLPFGPDDELIFRYFPREQVLLADSTTMHAYFDFSGSNLGKLSLPESVYDLEEAFRGASFNKCDYNKWAALSLMIEDVYRHTFNTAAPDTFTVYDMWGALDEKTHEVLMNAISEFDYETGFTDIWSSEHIREIEAIWPEVDDGGASDFAYELSQEMHFIWAALAYIDQNWPTSVQPHW